MALTAGKLILIDMLFEKVITISAEIAKVKAMSDEEVEKSLVAENTRSKQLKDLLEADM